MNSSFGRYVVLGRVDARYGTLWKAHDPDTERDVAIRQLQAAPDDPTFSARASATYWFNETPSFSAKSAAARFNEWGKFKDTRAFMSSPFVTHLRGPELQYRNARATPRNPAH